MPFSMCFRNTSLNQNKRTALLRMLLADEYTKRSILSGFMKEGMQVCAWEYGHYSHAKGC